MRCAQLSHPQKVKRKALMMPDASIWPCSRIKKAPSLLSILISTYIDKNYKNKHAWKLKEVKKGQ